ncbi:MAG: ring-opening amidohydrolase [Chloroflexi bacterium]|nr:ring-opening amidohydrolase [Chloroflexota bacterium]
MQAKVFKVPAGGPQDVSGIDQLIQSGAFQPQDVITILGKTEGNGCVNDFTRGYATLALKVYFADKLGVSLEEAGHRISPIMSGGTEGILSPHFSVFCAENAGKGDGKSPRLAIGAARTREFLPEEIGRMAQVLETARAAREAMAAAKITDAKEVHFVQIKCPLLTAARIEDAYHRGYTVATHDTYESMGFSRGASALGIALATGEVQEADLSDEKICHDWSLYSSVASTSAGIELMHNEILVMGNSTAWGGDLVIGHDVMADAIDADAVKRALVNAGLDFGWRPAEEQAQRIVNVYAKAEADPTGFVRSRRHTMLDDSDINQTRHARGVVGGVIAAIVGDPMVYVSGGAEHQGPAGGGPVAAIVRDRWVG